MGLGDGRRGGRFLPSRIERRRPRSWLDAQSPLRLRTGTTPPRPALLVTRKSAGRQAQSVRGTHLAG